MQLMQVFVGRVELDVLMVDVTEVVVAVRIWVQSLTPDVCVYHVEEVISLPHIAMREKLIKTMTEIPVYVVHLIHEVGVA